MKVSRTGKLQPKTLRMEKNEEETWIREALVRETTNMGKKDTQARRKEENNRRADRKMSTVRNGMA